LSYQPLAMIPFLVSVLKLISESSGQPCRVFALIIPQDRIPIVFSCNCRSRNIK
ncbi:hypothetical protein T11_12956, partial [Trichinella zimbabwensis]